MAFVFCVVGSGLAGMATALKLSEVGTVLLISKKTLLSGSTAHAQGGIAFSQSSPETHISDTIRTGSHHNDTSMVEVLVQGAPEAYAFLNNQGIVFDKKCHTEAGHSEPRVFHIADETGRYISEKLAENIRASEAITVLENAFVSDILVRDGRAYGVEVFHEEEQKRFFASKTVLATGGIGQIYSETTNPVESTGDGIAMAVRAGARLMDMEFVQFHPTALATDEAPLFLLSETLRGEGARVVNEQGEEVCDPLLPRDELSRIIFQEEQKGAVFLDCSARDTAFWKAEFPMISTKLQEYNLVLGRDQVPILPAAHFLCGGIEVDRWGRSAVKNLSAVGEVACTRVHGANRLASNSLLEALVFAEQIYQNYSNQMQKDILGTDVFGGHFETLPYVPEHESDAKIRQEIQSLLWKEVGIVRKQSHIERTISLLFQMKPIGTETKNMHATAIFVAEAAQKRKESLGCHFREAE